jgi:steroid 5-alpha reductase family enzyme
MKTFALFIAVGLLLSLAAMVPFAGGVAALASFVGEGQTLLVVALWALGFALASFAFGLVTRDYSWVDRTWSTLPVGFAWFYAWRSGFAPAPLAAALLVTFWGARLTFNFARKGGYAGMEDYRWRYLRQKIPNRFLWELFNLFFIAFFQLAVIFLFTYPVYRLTLYAAESLPPLFWVFSVLGIALVCFEFAADQQQWNFHAAKKAAAEKKDYPPKYAACVQNGFLSQGLFSASRHPNYFGELGFWWALWLAAFSLAGNPISSGIFGPLLLTVVIVGSTFLTESISASKYPAYRDYQKRVPSMIIPWFPR